MRNSTKKIFHRTLSGFLAILTVITMLATLSMLPVMAEEGEVNETSLKFNATYYQNYYTQVENKDRKTKFLTEEARLSAMKLHNSKGDFELYVDEITGEVALKDKSTGNVLFTTPYDTAEDTRISYDRKVELLSQVIINYSSISGSTGTYNSFTHSALLNQISIRKLKGGVRIEYSIGQEESRILVPMAITATRFKAMIEAPLLELFPDVDDVTTPYSKLTAFYGLYNEYSSKVEKYPVLKEKQLYLLHENTNGREKKQIESIIRRYCPDYTFEELDKDHKEAGYEGSAVAPANFKMALEYYITDVGVEVRFPANGLTFDESNYQLTDITLLKYMGAGPSNYKGYTFFPDGSGALVRFEDLSSYYNRGGSVYGQDYAYQEIGNANQEVFRMPVFGVVTTKEKRPEIATIPGSTDKKYSTGYLAIVTEGDALASIFTNHEGDSKFMYNSAYCKLAPRPQDQYNLAEAISISGSDTFTVVSDRKYTDSFRINFIMLTDEENPGKNPERTYYDASYVGMAKAYRDFLKNKGDIKRIENAEEDIPLYIEAFGVTETDETVLSIPVTVKKALTSFDNLKAMTTELETAKSPVTNINYRLTGFTNGGMKSTIPSKVKFEREAGGNAGFRDFLTFAAEKGIGVYPDFDFVYMSESAAFDGFSYKTDAVKTIDDRYTTKRTYDAVLQTFTSTGKICISSSVFRSLFDRFSKSFTAVLDDKQTFVSAGTLGSELNSDFDGDDPYNREDAKKFTIETLERLKKDYGAVMVDSGNAYTIPYASVVLNAPLDSSRYLGASEAIPFFGMTFHGFVEFAGKPTNMAGDMSYELLKIIENGATLYMMLSYDNVEILKEDEELSKYYAIRYEIWKEKLITHYVTKDNPDTVEVEEEKVKATTEGSDLVIQLDKYQKIVVEKDKFGNYVVDSEGNIIVGNGTTYIIDSEGYVISVGLYDKLNNALKDVQQSLINDHRFVTCKRKLTDAESANIEEDAKRQQAEKLAEYEAKLNDAKQKKAVYDRIVTEYPDVAERNMILANYGIDIDSINADIQNYTDLYNAENTNAKLEEYKNIILSGINLDIDDGSVVYVEYMSDAGVKHWFLLNYNNYDVEVTTYKLDANGNTITAVKNGDNLVFELDGKTIVVEKNEAGKYIVDSFGNIVVGNGTNLVIDKDSNVMAKLEIQSKDFFDSNTDKTVSYK